MIAKTLLLAAAVAVPCLWDRDTLEAESEAAPGIAEIAAGRFDRFPGAYYEVRLAECERRFGAGSTDLGLFDDAGVACDRLGRGDEAIEWMARKRRMLDELDSPDPFHAYTLLANLGTFHAHRWLRSGRDREDLADLERARDLIAEAIELNPDAHFGRERYQLLALEWFLEPLDANHRRQNPSLLTKAIGQGDWMSPRTDAVAEAGFPDAVEGLAGLVRLGDAWDSSAVWLALAQALRSRGHSSLARLAALRLEEILAADPAAVPAEGFEPEESYLLTSSGIEPDRTNAVDAWFADARRAADRWREARNAYVLGRIAAGRHPDTDAEFWSDWEDVHPLPPFPGDARSWEVDPLALTFALGSATIAFIAWRRARRRRLA